MLMLMCIVKLLLVLYLDLYCINQIFFVKIEMLEGICLGQLLGPKTFASQSVRC